MVAKTVLITGANRGIGLSFAKDLKQKGWNVIGTTRSLKAASELQAVASKVIELDVASEASIQQAAASLQSETIDLLINNAGLYHRRTLADLDAESCIQEFQVNALGPLLVSRAFLPQLRRSAAPRIINITSRMGSIADNTSGGSYGYRASKSALNAFTKSWSVDVADVPTILVHPGFIITDMTMGRGEMHPDDCVKAIYQNVLEEFVLKPAAECRWKTGMFVHRDGMELPW